jgi:hypothetical protein
LLRRRRCRVDIDRDRNVRYTVLVGESVFLDGDDFLLAGHIIGGRPATGPTVTLLTGVLASLSVSYIVTRTVRGLTHPFGHCGDSGRHMRKQIS